MGPNLAPPQATRAPEKVRRRRLATTFVAQMLIFGLITELLSSWFEAGHDFTPLAIPIRGFFFALLMLSISLWDERKERRRHDARSAEDAWK